jgi:toxin YxiD
MRAHWRMLIPVVLFLIAAAIGLPFRACNGQHEQAGSFKITLGQQSTPAPQGFRRNLSEDESHGGHTLSRHVGRTDEDLRQRLQRERISAASTYTDVLAAEQTVGATLHTNADRVQNWAQREGRKPNLALDFHGDAAHPVGRTMHRGDSTAQPCSNAVVVLKSEGSNGYYVLTSYPECR